MEKKNNPRLAVILLLLLVFTPFSSNQSFEQPKKKTTSSTSKTKKQLQEIFVCNSSSNSQGNIRPIWIDPASASVSRVGLLQTPNFPGPFALPLECLWIFNLASKPQQIYLHLYFTQVSKYIGFSSKNSEFRNFHALKTKREKWVHWEEAGLEARASSRAT